MLHLVVLAMIDLWDVDPAATAPAPPPLAQRLSGAGDASNGLLDASAALGPSPLKVCTYGAPPPLGSQLWSDAAGLMRTFTTPACDNGTGFASAFAALPGFGFSPLALGVPWGWTYAGPPQVGHPPSGHPSSTRESALGLPASTDLLRSVNLPQNAPQTHAVVTTTSHGAASRAHAQVRHLP